MEHIKTYYEVIIRNKDSVTHFFIKHFFKCAGYTALKDRLIMNLEGRS